MTRRRGQQLQRLRTFVRDVAGESAQEITSILGEHVAAVREAVMLAERAVREGEQGAGVDAEVEQVEHRGDELRRRLVGELAQTLVTPLDREDIFRLSRSVDDVLDNIRDFIREWTLYRPEAARNLSSLLESVRTGLEALAAAVAAIGSRPAGAAANLLAAKRSTNGVRRRFEEEVAELFAGAVSPEVLKHRELLRRLDVVGLRLGEAIDILFDALVKRGEGLSATPPSGATPPAGATTPSRAPRRRAGSPPDR